MSTFAGSILLFVSTGSLTDRLICMATHGPYTHVGLALSEDMMISATGRGIMRDAIPTNRPFTIVNVVDYTTEERVAEAMVWAVQQKGSPYGWSDIAYQVLKYLWPGNPLRFGWSGAWDCSDYATRYLIHAGLRLPDSFLDTATVAPNDLARLFSILAPRLHSIHDDVPLLRRTETLL